MTVTAQETKAPNPIITDIYTADPSAHVLKDASLVTKSGISRCKLISTGAR